MWTLMQREAIRFALNEQRDLREALEVFFAHEADKNRRSAESAMLSVPRQYEMAADYMARAAENESTLARLERAFDQSFAGPTG